MVPTTRRERAGGSTGVGLLKLDVAVDVVLDRGTVGARAASACVDVPRSADVPAPRAVVAVDRRLRLEPGRRLRRSR